MACSLFLPSTDFSSSSAFRIHSPPKLVYGISSLLHHSDPEKHKALNFSDVSYNLQRFNGAFQRFNGAFQLLWHPQNAIVKGEYGKKEKLSVTKSTDQALISKTYPESPLIKPSYLKPIIISLGIFSLSTVLCGFAQASGATIKASNLGLKIASILRQTGWPDEAIVFLMAMLPVLELRGAIPVGYWMQLDPLKLSLISILGNMVPVPFIVLYMEKLASFLSARSPAVKKIVDVIFESTRRKAGPIQEFKWLGLMLFVAVPFPGTGAWSGAMIASLLGMRFWDAISANFLGVVMAGVLVNLLVNLGFKYAMVVGIGLFLVSSFMWSFLRAVIQKNPQ